MAEQTERAMLGEVHGQPVDVVLIKLKGATTIPRELAEGDTLTIVATGEVTLPHYKRVKGVLVAEHTLVCEIVAETRDHLADEAASFLEAEENRLRAQRDSMEGQTAFDPETGEIIGGDDDGDDE